MMNKEKARYIFKIYHFIELLYNYTGLLYHLSHVYTSYNRIVVHESRIINYNYTSSPGRRGA